MVQGNLLEASMYFVYALLSKKDGRFYIDFTEDVEKRLKDHNEGKNTSTKTRRPLDIMRCIDSLGKKEFNLNEIYAFEKDLRILHPNNRHVKDKMRQQLQLLRNKGYLSFINNGRYRLI